MSDFIEVVISGRICKTPFLLGEADSRYMKVSVAARNRRQKDPETGELKYESSYLECFLFGSKAESFDKKNLSIGDDVTMIGELVEDIWEENGEKHFRYKCMVEKFHARQKEDPYKDIPF